MQEGKALIALGSIIILVGRLLLPRIQYGIILHDSEFDQALEWARNAGISQVEMIKKYPFSPLPRKKAAERYVALARYLEILPSGNVKNCTFTDIHHFTKQEQSLIQLSCVYNFFQGTNNAFRGNKYVTKANSLVALMRGLYPEKQFPLTDPYRTPYVDLAYQQGITHRTSNPYMNYLITQYESILQLRRVVKIKKGETR